MWVEASAETAAAAEKVVVVQLVAERALATVAAAGLEELAAAMEEVMVGSGMTAAVEEG